MVLIVVVFNLESPARDRPQSQPIKAAPFSHRLTTEFVSSLFWAGVFDVAVSGTYAYCATNGGVVVLNIGDPHEPIQISYVLLRAGTAGLAIRGQLLFVADMDQDLQIIDIADPYHPLLLAGVELPNVASDVAVSGDYAYVSTIQAGLQIVDVRDPLHAKHVGSYAVSDVVYGVDVEDHFAFVANGRLGVDVLDITSPTNPLRVALLATPGYAWDVDVNQGLAYVPNSGVLQIFDVSNPLHPVLLSTYVPPSSTSSVSVRPPLAYVTITTGGLHIVDVSNPRAPVAVATFNTPDNARKVTLQGDFALVPDKSSLEIIDIGDPGHPVFAGRFEAKSSISTLGFKEDYWFVQKPGTVEVYDVSNPYAVRLVTTYDQFGYLGTSSIQGDTAYLKELGRGIHLVDISEPLSPTSVGFYEGSIGSFSVAFPNLCMTASGVFYTVNIADPSHPDTLCSSRPSLPGVGFGAVHEISDTLIGLSTQWSFKTSSLDILNIFNAATPRNIKSYSWSEPNSLGGIGKIGSCVLVSVLYSGIEILEINKGRLEVISRYPDLWQPAGIASQGHYAFIADYQYGLTVLDMHDPTRPTKVAEFKTAGGATDVAITGNLAFVRSNGAIVIVKIFMPADSADDDFETSPVALLGPNSPNPFNASTSIEYALITPSQVGLDIYDALGRHVRSWSYQAVPAGQHRITWQATDEAGRPLPSGVYFGRFSVGDQSATLKMMLLK